jgi:hypothetical protein
VKDESTDRKKEVKDQRYDESSHEDDDESHNSSWLESCGHEKLETPGLGNGPKFV